MDGKPLALLTKEELFQEISSNLPELISEPDFILDYKLRVLSLSLSSRQEFIEETLSALKNNNQSLGAFLVNKSGTRLPPTVSNWLKDFREYVGSPVDEGKKEAYLNREEFKKLDVGARTILNNLFEFYELLENYERQPDQAGRTVVKDESGRVKIIDKGEFLVFETKAPAAETPGSPLPKIEAEERIAEPEPEETIAEEKPVPPPVSAEEIPKEIITEAEKNEGEADQVASVKAIAASYLHPDDEEEIKNQQNNISGFSLPELSGAEGVISGLIEKNNLSFPDDILEKRFKSVAISFLKGIRNKRETKDLFTRLTDQGGLEYSENLAEKLIQDLEQNESLMYAQKMISPALPPSVPTPQEALEKAMAEKAFLKPAPAEEKIYPAAGQQYDIPEPIKISSFETEKKEEEIPGPEEEKEIIEPEEKFRVKRPFFSDRRRMEDIKSKARAMGPLDELRTMDLNDFQRLGTEKISSVEKVYDKINLLKEDSFAKYAEGIKAWRNSEIYSLYLQIGSECMEQQKSIREIVAARKVASQPYLTFKEFNEIADLNQNLRY